MIIELTKQEEEELEIYIDDNIAFLANLQSKLKDKDIKLKLSLDLLTKLLLKSQKISRENDEYFIFINEFYPIHFRLDSLDLSNFKYNNLIINQETIDFMKKNNIVINLDEIYNKELVDIKFDSCIINGSFDNYILKNVTLKNNCDINGNSIKLNPQRIVNKELVNCSFDGIEFTDNFDGCNISGISIFNCKNAKINTNLIKNKDLSGCRFEQVFFDGEFENCDITGIYLRNNENVKINPQSIKNKDLSNVMIYGAIFTSSLDNCILKNIYIETEDGICASAKSFDISSYDKIYHCSKVTLYVFDLDDFNKAISNDTLTYKFPDTIVCLEKYALALKENNCYKNASFDIIPYEYNRQISKFINKITERKLEENLSIEKKVKKKNRFNKFLGRYN